MYDKNYSYSNRNITFTLYFDSLLDMISELEKLINDKDKDIFLESISENKSLEIARIISKYIDKA